MNIHEQIVSEISIVCKNDLSQIQIRRDLRFQTGTHWIDDAN